MMQYVVDKSDCTKLDPFAGVSMFVTEAEKMTLSLVEMEPHSVIEEHRHPHEQIGYMVEGEAEFVIDGKSFTVRGGQMWRLPGNVPHKVVTHDHGIRAVDVFYPIREDMRR